MTTTVYAWYYFGPYYKDLYETKEKEESLGWYADNITLTIRNTSVFVSTCTSSVNGT